MFKIHPSNIPQIKAVIKKFKGCWFHGDGNLYAKKEDSDFRVNFSNPNQEASKYRVFYDNVHDVPATVEGLERDLQYSTQKEKKEAAKPKAASGVDTISVEEDDPINTTKGPAANAGPGPGPEGEKGSIDQV